VHGADGGQPRQDRGRSAQVGGHGEGLLRAIQARPRPRQAGDAQREGRPAHRSDEPGVRARAAGAARAVREGPGLLRLSELQVRGLAEAGQRAVPEVRRRVRHRALPQEPHRPQLRAGRVRLRAGGRAPGGMKDPLAAFLRHLASEQDASPHTLRSYRADLLEFVQHAGHGERGEWLAAVDTRTVRAFLVRLHERGLDAVTIARKLAAVRSWFRFLVRRGVLERNVAREVRGPRTPKKLVSFLPVDEAAVLMDARPAGGPERPRDAAVLELLYASGLRVSELAGLDLDDVDRARQTVRVLGKGRKERIVPYGGRAASA